MISDMDTDIVKVNRAEIDTRAPFRSVKEAVTLFGEKVLAGQLQTNKLKQLQTNVEISDGSFRYYKNGESEDMSSELKKTKQLLVKARAEEAKLTDTLASLKLELENTKQELYEMKCGYSEINVVEQSTRTFGFRNEVGIERKRYVTFANPPDTVAQVIVPPLTGVMLERHPSLRRSKKKSLMQLVRSIFCRKKIVGLRNG